MRVSTEVVIDRNCGQIIQGTISSLRKAYIFLRIVSGFSKEKLGNIKKLKSFPVRLVWVDV